MTALALAENHPGLVDTVVAHEPPLVELLGDRDERHAGEDVVIERWFAGDHLGSWRAFLANAAIEMPEEMIQMIFGGEPDPAARADGDYQNAHLLRPTTHFRPDVGALRAGPHADRRGHRPGVRRPALRPQLAGARRRRWASQPTLFPGDHIGFADDPAAFEPVLRAVLPGPGQYSGQLRAPRRRAGRSIRRRARLKRSARTASSPRTRRSRMSPW